jgi:signal transduction histidine kinase
LFDFKSEELVLDSFYNSCHLQIKGLRRKVGEGVSGKVVETRMPILVRNIDQDARFKRNGFNHYRTKSFISIPLYTSAGVLGLINLTDKASKKPFSKKDFEFAVTLSKYACKTVADQLNSSKLKEENESLHKQNMTLEKYASMGKLAAGIVHEINNPLDGVMRYINILLHQIEDNSIAREYLLEAKTGLSGIANITKSLLEYSHQVNNVSQVKKYADLHELIDVSLNILKNKINGNIIIDKKYNKELPLILDQGIQHVFANMIKNAIDAMGEGQGKLEISTTLKDSIVEITFRDTGTGMSNEVKKHLFEPFFTTKDLGKGTGLGLSICKEIVKKYEGNIEVHSEPGKGSYFIILIPKKYFQNA